MAHHQRKREEGSAQRKLQLVLEGDEDDPTNLSEEFVEKWRNRCEKVDSIDCWILHYNESDSDDINEETAEEEDESEYDSEYSESGSRSSTPDQTE